LVEKEMRSVYLIGGEALLLSSKFVGTMIY